MRKLSTLLIGLIVSVGFAGSASALSITGDWQSFGGVLASGEVKFELTDNKRITMETRVTSGKMARARVTVTDADSGSLLHPTDAGADNSGSGVKVARIRVRSDGAVDFYFKDSFFHWHIHEGQTSNPFYVEFADGALEAGDQVTFAGYRHWIFGSFGSTTVSIVPEPSTAMLVGLGIAGLALAGRKR